MLKLKSVVKTREQLLATGWVRELDGGFSNDAIPFYVNASMIGGSYGSIISKTIAIKLDGCDIPDKIWNVNPEMVLVSDQWGFVRDPETLDILVFDAARSNYPFFVEGIDGLAKDYLIDVSTYGRDRASYSKMGQYYESRLSTLSKYPYSLQYGGYVPFDFEELKDAFNCPKVVEGDDDSSNDDSSTTNDDTPLTPVETVTTYQADGYEYCLTRRKI